MSEEDTTFAVVIAGFQYTGNHFSSYRSIRLQIKAILIKRRAL